MNPDELPEHPQDRKYRTIFVHPTLDEKIIVENEAKNRAAATGRACIAVGEGYIYQGSSHITNSD